jgi:hypothetical protein
MESIVTEVNEDTAQKIAIANCKQLPFTTCDDKLTVFRFIERRKLVGDLFAELTRINRLKFK